MVEWGQQSDIAEPGTLMDAPTRGEVTALLGRASEGDMNAAQSLFPIIYDQLRRVAASCMRRERGDHTLQPTALVHEAFLRLVGPGGVNYADRTHFFAVAAQGMRHILVDHARRHAAARRGSGRERVPLEIAQQTPVAERSVCLLALDAALERFTAIDPEAARVVELRFFAGLSVEETARMLSLSPRTVKRDWQSAKAWLSRAIRMDLQ